MPAPSKLAIATSSVTRLLKEEASYHKELEQQEARIKKSEQNRDGENADFQMKQEVGHSSSAYRCCRHSVCSSQAC